MRIIDCFLFYNEVDILEYRLKLLWDVVHVFVITEAYRTFTGASKPFFSEHPMFDKYRCKIQFVRLNELPFPSPDIQRNEQWKNENYQRDSLSLGLDAISLRSDDLIVLGDVDEIPDPETLVTLSSLHPDETVHTLFVLKQKYHCYNITVVRDLDWYHPKMFTYDTWKTVLRCSPLSSVRMYGVQTPFPSSLSLRLIEKGGWHLSYFGSSDFVMNKLSNFSHQEFDVSVSDVRYRMQHALDIMGQDHIAYSHVPVDKNMYLPPVLSPFMFFSEQSDNNNG